MTDTGVQPLLGFRRHLHPEIVADEAIYLFSEHGVTSIQAEQIEALVPLLDGTRDLAALLRDASTHLSPGRVAVLLRHLAEAGLLTAAAPARAGDDPRALAYWDAAGLDGYAALRRLEGATVSFVTVGDLDDGSVRAACATAGLVPVEHGTADLSIVLCADYLDDTLQHIDRKHRAGSRPWLLAKPVGTQAWIGPFFGSETACWHCLAHRLWTHRRAEAYVQQVLGRTGVVPRPAAAVPPSQHATAHLVALEAAKWLAGYRHPNHQAVWSLDTLTMQGRHHAVSRRPQCPSCGDPELMRERAAAPVRPVSRRKASTVGGGHRAMTAEQVLDRYRHLVSPVSGVVSDIRRDRRGPAFLNAYRAGANLAAGPRGLTHIRQGLRGEHGGKGVTAVQAEASALCEALERYSGSFHGDELRIRASLRDLGDEAVHPNAIQLIDERQYANRAAWNASHSAFQWIGQRFEERTPVDWTPVWSLTGGHRRLVPTSLLYYGTPPTAGSAALSADSNGNAAGSSIEDALLQGFFELVERDAVALWWYNRTRMPAVDLDAFATTDGWIDRLREVHRSLHREVWVLDLTTDLGVPAMVALSRRTDKPAEDITFGFGAHLDPRVALTRALTELNQLLPAVVGVDADGRGYTCDQADARRWWQTATVENQSYLRPAGGTLALRPDSYDHQPSTDLLDDVRRIEDMVAGHGLELLVLDQTRPDIGLPVAKVIVPGLRHFWARFAPGRLFDVPVRLGRVATPTPYEELNPVPIFV